MSVKSVKKFSLQCSLAPINPEQTGPPEKMAVKMKRESLKCYPSRR